MEGRSLLPPLSYLQLLVYLMLVYQAIFLEILDWMIIVTQSTKIDHYMRAT